VAGEELQILECKTAEEFGSRRWKDRVPDYIQCQVQHQFWDFVETEQGFRRAQCEAAAEGSFRASGSVPTHQAGKPAIPHPSMNAPLATRV
jgi:hypothetical protein